MLFRLLAHLRLHVVFYARLFDQAQLGLYPVHVFLF